jgi:glycosyltransferase involved in cell wall biosynthesis
VIRAGGSARQASSFRVSHDTHSGARSSGPSPSGSLESGSAPTGEASSVKRSRVVRKRVLTVADHLGSIGGTEAGQLAIFRGLVERGWEVHLLYVSKGDFWPAWNELAATTTQIGASLPSSSSPFTSTINTVEGALKGMRTSPSVMYVHNAGDVPIALAVGARTGARVAVHLHLPPPIRQPSWLNALMRRAAAAIAPSADTADRWISRAGLDPARVSVIPTGVDINRFVPLPRDQRMAVRAGVDVGDDEAMVIFAGRLERIKGPHFLVDAVGRLNGNVHLVLAGATRSSEYLQELQSLAQGHRVSFLGRRSDVPALMAAADLSVLPSIFLETQGLVVSESMACETPVIASDIGGLGASMRGFPEQLVPPGDPVRLAESIKKYVTWRRTEPDLGPRSRAWVLENMRFSETIGAVDEVITEAARRST